MPDELKLLTTLAEHAPGANDCIEDRQKISDLLQALGIAPAQSDGVVEYLAMRIIRDTEAYPTLESTKGRHGFEYPVETSRADHGGTFPWRAYAAIHRWLDEQAGPGESRSAA